MSRTGAAEPEQSSPFLLFLSGDVMTGRGIDQILPHPSKPVLYESYITDPRDYIVLAENINGRIPRPAAFGYIWGDALAILDGKRPDVRIINLETSITKSDACWPGKGIHYRMHPQNIGCLTSAAIDCCVLANNHVLDWGTGGLEETLTVLRQAGIKTAGAGLNRQEALKPAVVPVKDKGRVVVFAMGMESSGVLHGMNAGSNRPGIDVLPDLSAESVHSVRSRVESVRQPGDIVVFSLHWGDNWGYDISLAEAQFARSLIDTAGVDIVHGHSSHHPRAIEAYKDKLILYGCGDLLNDYEGIGGNEEYRGGLGLMYFVTMAPGGRLMGLELVPVKTVRFALRHVDANDGLWLLEMLNRESARFGTGFSMNSRGNIQLIVR